MEGTTYPSIRAFINEQKLEVISKMTEEVPHKA